MAMAHTICRCSYTSNRRCHTLNCFAHFGREKQKKFPFCTRWTGANRKFRRNNFFVSREREMMMMMGNGSNDDGLTTINSHGWRKEDNNKVNLCTTVHCVAHDQSTEHGAQLGSSSSSHTNVEETTLNETKTFKCHKSLSILINHEFMMKCVCV